MANLSYEKCVACRADSQMVTVDELLVLQPLVDQWDLIEEESVKQLKRVFKFSGFSSALDFSRSVGEVAEIEGHHPMMVTEWGKVTIYWWTHKIRGLHRNDFIMAAKTDQIFNSFQ